MRHVIASMLLALGLGAGTQANATLITFDDLAVGTTLANQYAGLGVTFSGTGFTGAGGPTGTWATNTDMTIVDASGADVGGLGSPSLVSGNLLRSFSGWLAEDGDASFTISFTSAVSDVALDMAGIATPASSRIFVYSGAALLGTVTAGATGQQHLAYSGSGITHVVVTPGDFFDWVGVDNLSFEAGAAVPEPASWALIIGGFALAGGTLRRRSVHARTVFA